MLGHTDKVVGTGMLGFISFSRERESPSEPASRTTEVKPELEAADTKSSVEEGKTECGCK